MLRVKLSSNKKNGGDKTQGLPLLQHRGPILSYLVKLFLWKKYF
jgi:hypothetical protein